MSPEYEHGKAKFDELVKSISLANRNEATTRLQLIDRIFFDCLGWSREIDVNLEEPHGQEYADYVFSAPRRILILEAKREGDYFEVPAGKVHIEISLNSIRRDFPNIRAAIDQVTRYCQSRGVLFAAVCNGHQIIAFVANRNDGVAPLEGRAVVFTSLEMMQTHFFNLWQALSKPAIEKKSLLRTLTGQATPDLPPKLSSLLTVYPGIKGRNVLQTDLQVLSELALEDIPNTQDVRPQFLKECYCPSGALAQHALVAKTILEASYAEFVNANETVPVLQPAVTKKGVSPDLLIQSLTRRPVLLIGDVGVGKTTFLQNLMDIEAVGIFQKGITLYLNLGVQATLTMDLRAFIPAELSSQLLRKYSIDVEESAFVRGVYNLELQRFEKGIYGDLKETNPSMFREKQIAFLSEKVSDRSEHLKNSLQHISKGRNKQIIILIDNADQRVESNIQQQAFLIAQEIAERWPATVFVSLRPETFHNSLREGSMSGYHPKAFTVSPPRIDFVVKKRLAFAKKITTGEIAVPSLQELQPSRLGVLIDIFLRSIDTNIDILECVENIAGTNVRRALDFIRNFFGSGHVDTEAMLRAASTYLVPLHQFLRALIFGDHEHYDPERSPIANLFDISRIDSKEHFLLPFLLSFLGSSSNSGLEGGFVPIEMVYDRLQGLGYVPDQIDSAIVSASRKNLLQTSGRTIPDAKKAMPRALRWTTIGAYHVTRLCRRFEYIDAMIVDTPILDPVVQKMIRDESDIRARIARGKIFLDYLDRQWAELGNNALGWDWSSVSKDVKHKIQGIESRI